MIIIRSTRSGRSVSIVSVFRNLRRVRGRVVNVVGLRIIRFERAF